MRHDPAATKCMCIDCLIERLSIGAGLADIKERGIYANLHDLERDMLRRRRKR